MASLKAKDALISINGEQISAQIVAGLSRKKSPQTFCAHLALIN